MGTLKVNGNIEASTMLKLNGDWETDFGILFQEGGGTSYGAFIKYGLNDYLTIGTRNDNNDITAIKIYRGDNSVTVNGSVTASSFIGNLNGNATSASSVPWSGITGKPSSFTPASHTHSYLPLSGGTMSGTLNVGGKVELWSDSEGGNIRLTSPNGSWWSIDALGNTSMRFIWAESSVPFTFTKDGTINATYFSGTANYANNAGYATTADETNASRGGGSIPWAGSFDSEPDVTAYRSMFSTYMDSSSTWWNLISNRHRNGSSDGYNYGMYIKCRLTGSWAHLLWNRQYGGSWQGERTIHDTGNVCISSSNPGNGSFYG